jgi:hypothetical protein
MGEQREMTLDEWVNRLPEFHRAHVEYKEALARAEAAEARVAEMKARWKALRKKVSDEFCAFDGPDCEYGNGPAAGVADRILDAMDDASPADVVRVTFATDAGGNPGLYDDDGVHIQNDLTLGDTLYLVRVEEGT